MAANNVPVGLDKEQIFGMAEKEMEYRVELFNKQRGSIILSAPTLLAGANNLSDFVIRRACINWLFFAYLDFHQCSILVLWFPLLTQRTKSKFVVVPETFLK